VSPHAGFTLVELLVVVAMIAILASVALTYAGERRPNLRAFAEQIVGEADSARLRAISSRRWQRMGFDGEARRVVVEQALWTGMERPDDDDDWVVVTRLEIPQSVVVAAIATSVNLVEGEAIPGEGDGLDEHLYFTPDGSGEPRTVYLRGIHARDGAHRVVVYRATGTAFAKERW
jgi:prepilin-type N-terminal cleavage/methylation domain-containing protein